MREQIRGVGDAMTERSDADLIAAHLAGERAAFDEIVDRYERRLYAVALRMCGDVETARDVTQEVFITALRSLKSFRGEARVSTWLHRVAVNASLDRLRRRQRRPELPLEQGGERAGASPDPEEAAVASERAVAVRHAVAALAPEFRAAVVLHDLQGLDYAEVAEALGIPLGTVKSRLHRARLELARALGHLRDQPREPASDEGPLT